MTLFLVGYLVLTLIFTLVLMNFRFLVWELLIVQIRLQRPPRSGLSERESRRNPERASRRQTRSMGGMEDPSPPQEADVELSLEEELLEVS